MTEVSPASSGKARQGGSARVLNLRLFPVLWRIVLAGLLVGLAGAYPTWKIVGVAGLNAELSAGVAVMIVMVVSACLTVRMSRQGVQAAALVFAMGGMVRVLACAALGGVAWAMYSLPPIPLCAWIFLFFMALFWVEVSWFVSALRGLAATDKPTGTGEARTPSA